MAAPTLQAQAESFTVATTASEVTPTIPAHVKDDILVATVVVWRPNTSESLNASGIPTPEGWNKAGEVELKPSQVDGFIGWFWKRATGEGTTVTFKSGTSPTWDTGTDGAYGARVDVVRGCATEGNPFDAFAKSGPYTTEFQNVPALEVKGTERLAMYFEAHNVDTANVLFNSLTGFTMGTNRGATTGTGGGTRNARKEVSESLAEAQAAHSAPTAGRYYAFGGFSFKPPPPTQTKTKKVSLAEAAEPENREGHAIKVKAYRAAAGSVVLKAALYEGSTNRSGWLETAALGESATEYSLAIPKANAEAITDYSNLTIAFYAYSAAAAKPEVRVTRLRLEVPGAKTTRKTLTAATESDAATALVARKPIYKTLTPATETDSAHTLAQKPLVTERSVEPATEADAGAALFVGKRMGVGAVAEADTATSVAVTKPIHKTAASATETDAAQSLAASKPIHKTATPASETDVAMGLAAVKPIHSAVDAVAEADAAQSLSATKPIHEAVSAATEADVAGVLKPKGGSQELRPDEDLETEGWTEVPLWEKLRDDSDVTVVKATLS